MKYLKLNIILITFLSLNSLIFGQSLSADQIMQKYKQQEKTKDTSVKLQMVLVSSNGGKREREVMRYSKTDNNDNEKQLIRFLSPADVKGTGFLSIEKNKSDDDNWLYLPALRKVRRISSSDKTDNFMGTEFTYEDLENENLEDYSYSLKGTDKIDGVDTYIIEAVPKSKNKKEETGYSKRELWISKDKYIMLQAKYYDKDGGLVKILKAEDVKQVPGTDKWRAYKMTINNIRENTSTVLELSDYVIDNGVKDSFFTERYLKRFN